MATYRVVEVETGRVTWTDCAVEAEHSEAMVDSNGDACYEVEMYCDHTDSRVCQGMGH